MSKRALKFKPDDTVHHIAEKKFGETWQIVATKPDAFSPLLGMFLIRMGGAWHRMNNGTRKDALGRIVPDIKSVAIVVVEDNPITEKGVITEMKVK